jgi:molybdopterin-guanine dinucleotide biosynthesis protein
MAVLPDNDRLALWADLMREMSASGEAVSITKADLRAALNAADAWADSNAAAYNTAIPQPARNALTARQKARLLMYVMRRRYEVS